MDHWICIYPGVFNYIGIGIGVVSIGTRRTNSLFTNGLLLASVLDEKNIIIHVEKL